MRDYISMINERDGGIGGVKIVYRGMRDRLRHQEGRRVLRAGEGKKPRRLNPWSTGITLPRSRGGVDKIPVLSMAYGLSASAEGNNFPWVFNPPATYWDGASVMVSLHGGSEGGLDKLKGKKLGLSISTLPTARSRSRCSSNLAKKYGFEVKLYPVPRPTCRTRVPLALDPPRQAGLPLQPGLGRDEPDRGQGSDQEQLPDRQDGRRLVGRRRRRCARRRRRRQGLQAR
jgi:hypothetical protein